MQVVYSASHLGHEPPFEISGGEVVPPYEVGARAEAIREALERDGALVFTEPREHGEGPILAVHDAGLLAYLERAWREWLAGGTGTAAIFPDALVHERYREGMGTVREPASPCAQVGYWCFDTATPIVAGTYRAARAAVDVALTAADLVLAGAPAAYGLCRPPGHHTARALFGGYGYLNNAAIAAQWLADRSGEPVAILDVDFHHGNGTQQIFWERGDVLYCSLHADPDRMFPYFSGFADETGGGAGWGATLNVPLPRATDDAAYLAALEAPLAALADFPGSLLVVSLGIDTYGRDPIGDFALTTSAYHEIGRRAGSTGRRLVILQEGGYFIDDLGENVRQWLAGARVGLGLDPGDEAASGTGDGAPSGAEGGAVLEERTS